eukprot:961299-Rhodomonas_salina.2
MPALRVLLLAADRQAQMERGSSVLLVPHALRITHQLELAVNDAMPHNVLHRHHHAPDLIVRPELIPVHHHERERVRRVCAVLLEGERKGLVEVRVQRSLVHSRLLRGLLPDVHAHIRVRFPHDVHLRQMLRALDPHSERVRRALSARVRSHRCRVVESASSVMLRPRALDRRALATVQGGA